MRGDHHPRPLFDQVAQRRERRHDARIVSHLPFSVERHVHVHAHEDPPSLDGNLAQPPEAGSAHALPRRRSASTMRFEKPHSLSYQEKTFTTRSPETMVSGASKIEECGFPMMSHETMGSSLYWRIPFIGPLAASRIASFTLWMVAFLDTFTVRSTTDPVATGTRTEMPSSRPWSVGSTSPIA